MTETATQDATWPDLRGRRNRVRRLARRNDMVAMRRHQAYRRIGGQL